VIGSPAGAALIAQVAFWGFLLYGWAVGELTLKVVILFTLLWLASRLATAMFSPLVAMLDIALVFIIFKGDVRLT